jgi:hypothetical protein
MSDADTLTVSCDSFLQKRHCNIDLSIIFAALYQLLFHVSVWARIVVDIVVGSAAAQAVTGRLSTEAAQVRSQVKSCGICGEQSGTRAGFLPVLRFPLPILIPPNVPC